MAFYRHLGFVAHSEHRPTGRLDWAALEQIADLFQVPRTTIYGHLEPGSAAKRLSARNADWQRPPSDGRW